VAILLTGLKTAALAAIVLVALAMSQEMPPTSSA